MGGSIGVTIRDYRGKEHRMCRWTNALPDLVKNVDFLEGKEEPIIQYLADWYRMVLDQKLATQTHTPTRYPMTEGYISHPYLAPEGYGLCLIDCTKKTIINCQGYSTLEHITSSEIVVCSDPKDPQDSYRRLWDAGKLRLKHSYGVPSPARNPEYWPQLDCQKAHLLMRNLGPGQSLTFILESEPWEIIDCKDTANRWELIYTAVKGQGFVLTEHEESLWKAWIQERREWEKQSALNVAEVPETKEEG